MNIFKKNLFLLFMIGMNFNTSVVSMQNQVYGDQNLNKPLTEKAHDIEKEQDIILGDRVTKMLSGAAAAGLILFMFLGYYIGTSTTNSEGEVINTQDTTTFIINSIGAFLILLSSACLSHHGFKKDSITVLNILCMLYLAVIGMIITLAEFDIITSTIMCGFTGNTSTGTMGLVDGFIMLGGFAVLLVRTIFSECGHTAYKPVVVFGR